MLRTDVKLEKQEQSIYEFIQGKFPHLLEAYLECVPRARLMIMERMVNALLREGFLPRESIETQLEMTKELAFATAEGQLEIPIQARYSYQRYKINENPSFQGRELFHPTELLPILKMMEPISAYTNLARFQEELSNSVANLGLSLLFQKVRTQEIQQTGARTISEWLEQLADKNPNGSSSLLFEQLSVTGHLLHPCTKSKFGLTTDEIMAFSAEFNGTVTIHFVAIDKNIAYFNSKINRSAIDTFWAHEYPELVEEVEKLCHHLNKPASDFYIIPVHSWQRENTLRSLYPHEIATNQILLLDFSIKALPTLSVRTLAPVGKSFHIKLPLNIQMTSAVRTISPHSIHNGPEISLIVEQILQKESHFGQSLHIIGEDFGVRFASSDETEVSYRDRNKNLSYLIRRAPESFLDVGEHAIVACALFNLSPTTDDLLLYELVEIFQSQHAFRPRSENVIRFFEQYIQTLLTGVLPMMTKYGIGLEAHLQNTLMVFNEKAVPVKVLVRDLGGVRIDSRRLEKHGYAGSYYPGSVTVGEDEVGMQNKVIHTAFQSQIGELTAHLASKYEMNEAVFWDIVKAICLEIFEGLKKDEDIRQYVESDLAALLGETVQTKALTLMRLTDDVTDYAFIDLPNPLSK